MRSSSRLFLAGLSVAVLCGSTFVGEAKAGNVVSIWFKTPGDRFETYADEATKGYDGNGEVYYYYNPARSMDDWPVCVDPNGLRVYYRYANQDNDTYYAMGGTLYLWHGRMSVLLGLVHDTNHAVYSYVSDDQGDVYISDLPDGNYVPHASAYLQGAYIQTTDGHLSWFGNGGSPALNTVSYYNVMSYQSPATGRYQAYTWYDLLSTGDYNGWHPYRNGFEINGGYASMDLRISYISSQLVTRIY